MKKLIYFSLIVLLSSCSTDKPDYFDTDFKKVSDYAAKKDKMIFIDFYTLWCGPCKYFEKNIKYDSLFKSYISQNFITLQIDAELKNNKEFVSNYDLTGYPTFVILDSDGSEIDRIVGLGENVPDGFIDLVKGIISGSEELSLLKETYIQYPDSVELFRKVVLDKLLGKNLYDKAIDMAEYAINNSQDSNLIQEARYWKAYSSIRNPQVKSPNLMIELVSSTDNEELREHAYNELFIYYRSINHLDSTEICLTKLTSFESGNHLGYVRDYAKFLYTNDRNTELANKLTEEYTQTPGNEADHWTPYLNGHRLAKQGDVKSGIMDFDKWMLKYSKPEDFRKDKWHYVYYIDLIKHYKIASETAIKYAQQFEKNNPNIGNKRQLADLYYFNGQVDEAIAKIKEIQTKIEDPKKKAEYDNLIKKYTD